MGDNSISYFTTQRRRLIHKHQRDSNPNARQKKKKQTTGGFNDLVWLQNTLTCLPVIHQDVLMPKAT